LVLPEPPVPIAASFNAPGPTIVVMSTFLTPGPLDPTNWSITENFRKFTVTTAQVVPAYPNPVVELTRGFTQFDLSFDHVDYTPPPFDLTSRIGNLPAPAFPAFPLQP
jgi:hypothetical protein